VLKDISEAADGQELTENQKHEFQSFSRGIRVSLQCTFANESAADERQLELPPDDNYNSRNLRGL